MRMYSKIILPQCFFSIFAIIANYKKYFSIFFRRQMEIIHFLIPNCQLGTGDFVAFCPFMRFTFNNNFIIVAAEIITMLFMFFLYAYRYANIIFKLYPFTGKESIRYINKISPNMRITYRAFSLKIFHLD